MGNTMDKEDKNKQIFTVLVNLPHGSSGNYQNDIKTLRGRCSLNPYCKGFSFHLLIMYLLILCEMSSLLHSDHIQRIWNPHPKESENLPLHFKKYHPNMLQSDFVSWVKQLSGKAGPFLLTFPFKDEKTLTFHVVTGMIFSWY